MDTSQREIVSERLNKFCKSNSGTHGVGKLTAGTGPCYDLYHQAIQFEYCIIFICAFEEISLRHQFLNNILRYLQA